MRDDSRRTPLLYQMPVMTSQAYNNYPIGRNPRQEPLRLQQLRGSHTVTGTPRAVQVSFDRPYKGSGDGDFMLSDVYFLHWLERSGYDVSYSTDVDTHVQGARLLDHRALLSVGHDEYWTKAMYDAAQAARDRGRDTLGSSAPTRSYWQVRMAPASDGTAQPRHRLLPESPQLDPVRGATSTVRWRDPPVSRPEQTLVGIQYGTPVQPERRPAHHQHRTAGSTRERASPTARRCPGFVGDEVDRLDPDLPPARVSQSYLTLSSSPLAAAPPAESSLYQAPAAPGCSPRERSRGAWAWTGHSRTRASSA